MLLSVDIGYGDTYATAKRDAQEIMKKYKVDWPSVIEPEGWKGVNRTFNVDGYQLILVGPDGKVISPDARAEELEKLLKPRLGKAA